MHTLGCKLNKCWDLGAEKLGPLTLEINAFVALLVISNIGFYKDNGIYLGFMTRAFFIWLSNITVS